MPRGITLTSWIPLFVWGMGTLNGIVFTLLAGGVRAGHGEDAWGGLRDRTGLDSVYASLGGYPDGDLAQRVEAASTAPGRPGVLTIAFTPSAD
jgi:hypothetical protein